MKDYKYYQSLIDNKIEELKTQNLSTEQGLQIQNLQYNALTSNSVFTLQDILNTLDTIVPIEEPKPSEDSSVSEEAAPQENLGYSTSDFKFNGVIYSDGIRYT